MKYYLETDLGNRFRMLIEHHGEVVAVSHLVVAEATVSLTHWGVTYMAGRRMPNPRIIYMVEPAEPLETILVSEQIRANPLSSTHPAGFPIDTYCTGYRLIPA